MANRLTQVALATAISLGGVSAPTQTAEAKGSGGAAIVKAIGTILKGASKIKILSSGNVFNHVYYGTRASVDYYKLYNTTPESLAEEGNKYYKTIIETAEKEGKIKRESLEFKDTQSIMFSITPILNKFPKYDEQLKSMKWDITYIEDDSIVNAFCLPGGKMVVYSGLVKKLNLTRDELAIVIGHEMGHALEEHGLERMVKIFKDRAAMDTVSALTGRDHAILRLSDILNELSFSRENESEADTVGLIYAYAAGYDIDAGVSLWEKFAKLKGNTSFPILSTHPSSNERVGNLKILIQKIREDSKSVEGLMSKKDVKVK